MPYRWYYLTPNLKIGDVARQTGICRTYVSQYIYDKYGCSFTDYINSLRIEYAKTLMLEEECPKLIIVAERSGLASESSFYGNFRKFAGMSPNEWDKKTAVLVCL